jgi:hypothetical protein
MSHAGVGINDDTVDTHFVIGHWPIRETFSWTRMDRFPDAALVGGNLFRALFDTVE